MWANENAYDDLITAAAVEYGPAVAVIKGVIGQESGFDPDAVRVEAAIGDQSTGLMQLLYRTAQGLGYTGDVEGLKDPATNIQLGTQLLAQLYGQAGNWPGAISAYNGGWRPSLGMGVPVTRLTTVCLARDSSGKCIKSYTAQPGEYGNQEYVDSVMANVRYFQGLQGSPGSGLDTGSAGAGGVGAGLALLAALGAWWYATRRGPR